MSGMNERSLLFVALLVGAVAFALVMSTPKPEPQPVPDDLDGDVFAEAAEMAIVGYAAGLANLWRDTSESLPSDIDTWDELHEYLSPRAAEIRKNAFARLGMLIDTEPDKNRERMSEILYKVSVGFERAAD